MGARRGRGIVLDELNAALRTARAALRAGHLHRQPRDGRRDDLQQFQRARDRSCTEKRFDHVLDLEVVLSDGSVTHFRPLDATELEAACVGRQAWRRPVIEPSGSWRRRMRLKIDRRFPKVLRRVGGYNLDEFVDRHRAVQPHEN
jgi:hypothetical protein